MVTSKYIVRITVVIMAAAVLLCLFAVGYSAPLTELLGGTAITVEYESKLFDTDQILEIDIRMDESQWDDMLENAIQEEYYSCDVAVNGELFSNVAIRPKGNTSLSAIAMDPTTDRYSLKLEFDHYVGGQTCYGLDKLILNNNYADATNRKEAIVYDMYQYLDADASLYNYAKISVNGTYWGVYLALEAVEESFMLRNYDTKDGMLYKPDSMNMGGGKERPDDLEADGARPEMPNMPNDKNFPMPEREGDNPGEFQAPEDFKDQMPPDGEGLPLDKPGKGGFGMGSGGANLNYSDDALSSYETIWDGAVTNSGKNDQKRVIKALKNIHDGNDLETYMDVDNLLKYMAVHAFSVNLDSLSGNMAHNYYLYESNGRLNILPWDYNLAFGGMSMGTSGQASDIINDAVDTPFSGTEFFDALLEDENYLAQYHAYLNQLVDAYVFGGQLDQTYSRIESQIDTLVADDPTAFYSYEEYEAAGEMLYDTICLRAESIKGQLEGTIPSTDEGQKANSTALVDASAIDLDVMGVFQQGGKNANRPQDMEAASEQKEFSSNPWPSENQNEAGFGGKFNRERPVSMDRTHYWIYLGCFVLMLAALFCASRFKRHSYSNLKRK